MSSSYTVLDPDEASQWDVFELGSPSSFYPPPAGSHWLRLSNQNGDVCSRPESGHEPNVPTANDIVELSRGGPDFGSLSPFGRDLEQLTITTVNPKETVLCFKDDHTFPPITPETQIPPQLPAPSAHPRLLPFENVSPSPILQGINSRGYLGDAFLRPNTDIRGNRALPAKPFACAGNCGDSECISKFASKSNLARHCRPTDKRRKPCEDCGINILRQNMARHRRTCVAK